MKINILSNLINNEINENGAKYILDIIKNINNLNILELNIYNFLINNNINYFIIL